MLSVPPSLVPESSVSVCVQGTAASGFSTPPASDNVSDPHLTGGSVKSRRRFGPLPAGFYAGTAALLVAVGSLSLLPLWLLMCRLWATDPLRSIGAVFPLVACLGVLVAWRRLGWAMNGVFWALPLVALSILLARVATSNAFRVERLGHWIGQIHCGYVFFLYGIGAVLLFGGPRLLRAAILPLCLLLLVNPVPRPFNAIVDLPLQHLSASTARGFAHLIGLQPTGDQLRMMFAPDFGMMIVPGCNGVRGAITLGYLALIFGYARRLKPGRLSLVALAGLLLGYAFNLLRLCMLVVYYRIGLSVPSIQKHGVGVDYAIGCTLFLFGALGIGMLIRSLETRPTAAAPQPERKPEAGSFSVRPPARSVGYATAARALCFFVLTLVFIVPAIRTAASVYALRPNEKAVIASLPAKVGPYRLLRTYAEHDSSGMIVLAIGEYSGSPGEGSAANNLTLGLWVGSGNHFVAACRVAQGVGADWTGAFDAVTPPALPVHFATSFYDDGISRQYDAETACSESGCSGYVAGSRREGFFVVAPTLSELVFTRSGKRLPILLRREWPDRDSVPSATLRAHFESDARLFMKELDLRPLVQEYGSQP